MHGLSSEIPRGVVAGFPGPNGAGQTTTMAMLLGLVRPSAGAGTVLGAPLDDPRRYLNRVGLGGGGGDRFRSCFFGMRQRLAIAALCSASWSCCSSTSLEPAWTPSSRATCASSSPGSPGGRRTVFVFSHALGDLVQICDYLLVIDSGALLYQRPAADFLAEAVLQVFAAPEHAADLTRLAEHSGARA